MCKVFLKVPFSEKDIAKEKGARFDSDLKLWYCSPNINIDLFIQWCIYLDCPFCQKDEVKKKGAKFDPEKKLWFIEPNSNLSEFSKWLPSNYSLDNNSKNQQQQHKEVKELPKSVKIIQQKTETKLNSDSIKNNDSTMLLKLQNQIKQNCNLNVEELKEKLKLNGNKGLTSLSKHQLIDKCMEQNLLNISLETPKPIISKKRKNIDNESSSNKKIIEKIPTEFECPISYDIMNDPVICSDGHTYERGEIIKWLKTNNTSPKTNIKLKNKKLTPNLSLKMLIDDWKENNK
jgi:hypothetical protein